MKHFLKIFEGIDVLPLLAAIRMRDHLWNQNNLRTTHPGTAHSEADDIWLRFNELTKDGDNVHVVNDLQCINYPAFAELPQARPLIFGLMARVEGEQLGRCLITRLRPGARIAPHEDLGAPATFYERFHILLQCPPGAIFRTGDEVLQMHQGECWWFDNSVEHEIVNNGADDRITMIVDIRVSK